jgi:predicted MFS family arabinose efflux permease
MRDGKGAVRFGGLWRQPDFLKLWAGQSVSVLGDQVGFLALPLTAVLVLRATPVEMGFLGAAERAPFLLIGLFAGVWIDRRRRRPVLIGADVGRALLVGSIPVVALLGWLGMGYLYWVAFVIGVLTVLFDVAYQSYLPALVARDRLVEGNSKLEVSSSVAQIVGPSVAGVLVQILTAPLALLVDALSFVVSVTSLSFIRAPEPKPERAADRASLRDELGEGVATVFKSPLLRAIAGCTGTSNLFSNATFAIFVLYATRDLAIGPAALGLVLAAMGPGALLGALLAGYLARRLGLGRTLIGAILVGGFGEWLVPLASGPPSVAAAMIAFGFFFVGLSNPIYNINQVSLRQAITPDRLLGRMNATMRFLVWGTMPIGSLLGGFLGGTIGLRPTLAVAAIGSSLVFLWVFLSPVRTLREPPTSADE